MGNGGAMSTVMITKYLLTLFVVCQMEKGEGTIALENKNKNVII